MDIQKPRVTITRCTVWCGVIAENIIGPYFFENDTRVMVNVDSHQYRTMVRYREQSRVVVPIRVRATAYTARETMTLLREIFGYRIISRFSNFNWPPRSPDLTFLWSYLKGKVYANKPRTIQRLKVNIREKKRGRCDLKF